MCHCVILMPCALIHLEVSIVCAMMDIWGMEAHVKVMASFFLLPCNIYLLITINLVFQILMSVISTMEAAVNYAITHLVVLCVTASLAMNLI